MAPRGQGVERNPHAEAIQVIGYIALSRRRARVKEEPQRRVRVPLCDPAGACAFLALLLHALEIQSLRMKPSPPQFSVQWPYYTLGLGTVLFIVAGECPGACASLLAICLDSGAVDALELCFSELQLLATCG